MEEEGCAQSEEESAAVIDQLTPRVSPQNSARSKDSNTPSNKHQIAASFKAMSKQQTAEFGGPNAASVD